MFSGIIFDVGKIKNVRKSNGQKRINIILNKEIPNAEKGMSIAVNGACLTASEIKNAKEFSADATQETLKKTNLTALRSGISVNIEFPLTADKFLSGHMVQGHIDCTGKVARITRKGANIVIEVSFPKQFGKYIVEKGSITVDGTSLTAFNVKNSTFQSSIIPETFKMTTMRYYKAGTTVNLEFDVIGKYVEKVFK